MNRREFLSLTASGAITVLSGCTGSADPAETHSDSDAWPLHAHDAANSNHVPAAVGPRTEPDVEWTRTVTENRRYSYNAPSPVVVDGTVYAGGDGLFALDAADGSIEWRTMTDETVYGPAIVGETVYAGSSQGERSRVRAFDADEGTVRWSFEDRLKGPRFRPAIVTDETVYSTVNYGNERPSTPSDGRLIALAADDGEKRWSLSLEGSRNPPPAVSGTDVYVAGTEDSHACAVGSRQGPIDDLFDGSPDRNWRSDALISPEVPPAVVGDTVYYGDRDFSTTVIDGVPSIEVHALSTDNGRVEWHEPLGFDVPTPSVTDDRVYVTNTVAAAEDSDTGDSTSNVIVAAYGHDGTQHWETTLGDRSGWASPVSTAETLYVATTSGKGDGSDPRIHAFDRDDGTVSWTRAVPSSVATLAVAGGSLYAASWDGTVLALGN
jgi:outer membrane protein assembly factor BamB